MKLKERPIYIDKLIAARDNGLVKVVVGMRRCGKSSLLELFAQHLRKSGMPEANIVFLKLESSACFDILDHRDLVDAVKMRVEGRGRCCVLLDEVQLVEAWERAVNALCVDFDVDVYLTGSNAYLLSSQLATLLSGRYIEIQMYPLSFREFVDFTGEQNHERALERYLKHGGLPPVVEQGEDGALAQTVLSGIYNTVFVKDIAQHVQIRNPLVFNDVACFLADTAGSSVSITNIGNRLKSARRQTATDTIERYLQALVDAFLFYRTKRFDMRGGTILQGLDKYYPSDLGIKNMLLGFPKRDYGFSFETIVHNELKVRGYEVRIGKADACEIDFIATRFDEVLYVQVSASILDEGTRRREFEAFRAVPWGAGHMLLITADKIGLGRTDGVEVVNLVDWLLKPGR
ncbi:ATP-binding protein [Raoultibacter phocaeensis]|uniref:ATP-binding protein n=1 Tax=Raoultibacter phocaeensis TaxID=2479841 RepID=UPI00111801EA|nr:ATP-binding protein [Raoultibacter phocaeensis]